MKTRKIIKQGKIKHVPHRTCITCRKTQDKQALIRIVKNPEGNMEIDINGKIPGRGAYLCKNVNCWEEGLKGRRLEYALQTIVNQENKRRFMIWIQEYLNQNDINPE